MDDTHSPAPVRGALLAGALAAVVAALVSLPLHSPHDALLNSASVTWGVLLLALLSGIVYRRLGGSPNAARRFALVMAVGFLAWVAVAFAMGTMLTRMVSFTVPLAAIAFGGVAVLTPMLSRTRLAARWPAVIVALVVAVAVGIGFAGQGDQESGRLELPPRAGYDTLRTDT
ncbi:MAG: hypothetical protein OXL97_02835 [Chloroflexota bacterium]|nr:hypothetical protein [Chloroflexota bacterium]MDE2885742.1 hypothetical protein [Chloroflexota bacterium]